MKNFLKKEIAIYNHFKKLEIVLIPNFSTKTSSNFSIDRLCEEFVENLQNDFFHTVHTLLRSGDKLSTPEVNSYESYLLTCIFCSRYDIKIKSMFYFFIISKLSPSEIDILRKYILETYNNYNNEKIENHCNCNSQNYCCKEIQKVSMNLQYYLCYNCQKIFPDIQTIELFPPIIKNKFISMTNSLKLKEKIKEYLI